MPKESLEADLGLVLFRVGGVRYGADAAQVVSATALREMDPDNLRWFHESMNYPKGSVDYLNPVVLSLHAGSAKIIVDGLEDIVRVPLSDLSPFPSMVEPAVRKRGLWAVAKQDQDLILLVDLQQLAAERTPIPDPAPCSS